MSFGKRIEDYKKKTMGLSEVNWIKNKPSNHMGNIKYLFAFYQIIIVNTKKKVKHKKDFISLHKF